VSQLLQQAHDDRYGLYINGRYIDSLAQKYIPSLDPTSDDPWYEISDASAGDVDAAVSAARAALANPAWSRLRPDRAWEITEKAGRSYFRAC
jgi:acyl-CoA reductase-like NAD-dependent aldehyde dehydrogenase